MKRICMICEGCYGEKEPLEDTSETHGVCDTCLPAWREKLKESRANA